MAEFHVTRADGSVAGFTDQAKADSYAAGIGGEVVEVVDVDAQPQQTVESSQGTDAGYPVTAD